MRPAEGDLPPFESIPKRVTPVEQQNPEVEAEKHPEQEKEPEE